MLQIKTFCPISIVLSKSRIHNTPQMKQSTVPTSSWQALFCWASPFPCYQSPLSSPLSACTCLLRCSDHQGQLLGGEEALSETDDLGNNTTQHPAAAAEWASITRHFWTVPTKTVHNPTRLVRILVSWRCSSKTIMSHREAVFVFMILWHYIAQNLPCPCWRLYPAKSAMQH